MTALLLTVMLLTTQTVASDVTAEQKRQFTALLADLPTKGEFYTDSAVTKAEPYLFVLLAFTEDDLAPQDIYPYAAISRGLCDRPHNRAYVLAHFDDIRHPMLKLFWAAMLFEEGSSSPKILTYLRHAVESPEQADLLSQIVGPEYPEFRAKVLAARTDNHP